MNLENKKMNIIPKNLMESRAVMCAMNVSNLGVGQFKIRPKGIVTLIEIVKGIVGLGLVFAFMYVILKLANIGAL